MTNDKIYYYSAVGKGFFIILCVTILAFLVDSLLEEQLGYASLFSVALTWALGFTLALERRRIVLGSDGIKVHRLLPDKSIRYEDITQIRMGDSLDAVQVYASDGWWPDVSVHYGIHDWKGLAIELVERVPPEVEVVDRWGVTADVQQGAKWSGPLAETR